MQKIETQKISFFSSATSSKQTHLNINDYFFGIINGKWQDVVINYRNAKATKENIPAVTVSGLFTGRKDSDISEHSGLLAIDIDEKDQKRVISEIREELKQIPEVYAIHYSLGGKGLAVYFRVNKSKHSESFQAITKMLANDYEVVCDMHCGNVGRLRFVSYDPECYLNYGADCWTQFEKKPGKGQQTENSFTRHIYSDNDLNYILQQIKERQVNIAPDYYSWLRIGFGLASKLGESGREAFRTVSSFYYDKQKIDPDKQYDRCLKSDNLAK